MEHQRVGRRRARRHTISVAGSYRTGAGSARAVELRDVSEAGCRFSDVSNTLYVGTQLVVRVGDLGAVDATVAWIDGRMTGVRFNQPLYGPLLDHLCVSFGYPRDALERRRSTRPAD